MRPVKRIYMETKNIILFALLCAVVFMLLISILDSVLDGGDGEEERP